MTSTEIIEQLKEVVSGRRGYVSLTRAAKASGINKHALAAAAKALGLETDNHGKYGLCASRAARAKAKGAAAE